MNFENNHNRSKFIKKFTKKNKTKFLCTKENLQKLLVLKKSDPTKFDRYHNFKMSSKNLIKAIVKWRGWFARAFYKKLFRAVYWCKKRRLEMAYRYRDVVFYKNIKRIAKRKLRKQKNWQKSTHKNNNIGGDYFKKSKIFFSNRVNLLKYKNKDIRNIQTHKIKTWLLHLQPSFSNYMLTLVNPKNKVVTCATSGSSGIKGRKKYKTSIRSVRVIMKKILPYIKMFKIKKLSLVLYSYRPKALPLVIGALQSFRVKIAGFDLRIKRAHNGVRARKSIRR